MASSMKKKSGSSKDHTYDSNRIKDNDTNSFLNEERRLLKKPVANQISQKRTSKLNSRVNQRSSKLTDKCENPLAMIEQNFEYIAVVDFEATCEQNGGNNYRHEIIEFPIVLINVQEQTIVDQFQSYCRPIINPILSKFCTDLTGIEQHQVDGAPPFVEVLRNVETWLNERNLLSSTNKRRLAFATDGPWDFANFLRMQCHISSIPFPRWANKWINIRKEFASFYGVRRCGIDKMLEKSGLSFDGHRHSGLDDAINIARIAVELLKDGCVLLLNDGIHASDPKFAALIEEKTELSNDDDGEENPIVFKD